MDVHGDLLVVHSKYNKPDVFQIRPPQVVKEKVNMLPFIITFYFYLPFIHTVKEKVNKNSIYFCLFV